ncbi:MAG: hypothetical protein ABSC42_12215 [Tepidisphaeraceae bacterium]|jgi:chromosome segregation ATPase
MKLVIAAVLLTAIIISHQWINSGLAEMQKGREDAERKLQQDYIDSTSTYHEIQRLEGVNNELLATKQQLADMTQRASTLQDQVFVLQNKIWHSHSDSEVDDLKRQLSVALAATSPPHPEASPVGGQSQQEMDSDPAARPSIESEIQKESKLRDGPAYKKQYRVEIALRNYKELSAELHTATVSLQGESNANEIREKQSAVNDLQDKVNKAQEELNDAEAQ